MHVRAARLDDLAAIVALLSEGEHFEVGDEQRAAFASIEADPRNELLVLDDGTGDVLGSLQVTYVPGLGRGGGDRALVEGVRVREDLRGRGLGRMLMEAVRERAVARGCVLVQLTSNKRRTDAHRFYVSLGYEPSHVGFKLAL